MVCVPVQHRLVEKHTVLSDIQTTYRQQLWMNVSLQIRPDQDSILTIVSLFVRIIVWLCWGSCQHSNQHRSIKLKSHDRGQTPRGEPQVSRLTPQPSQLSSCCRHSNPNLSAPIKCPIYPMWSQTPRSHNLDKNPSITTVVVHGSFRTPVQLQISRGSRLIILSKEIFHFDGKPKEATGALSTLPPNSTGSC